MAGISGKTVVVGVKPGALSKELFTWCLVEVVAPGDCVIALHVIGNNDTRDQDGEAPLFAMVREYDSLLSMYEGFRNFKQVELKLKIRRGSSIGEILVREAKSCSASMIILGGAASKSCRIRRSNSVAKYCARKLAKDCSVLAILNGKIVFHKEASKPSAKIDDGSRGINNQLRKEVMVKEKSDPDGLILKNNSCDVCEPLGLAALDCQPEKKQEELGSAKKVTGKNLMALMRISHGEELVPVDSKPDTTISCTASVVGWPLMRKTFLSAIRENSVPLMGLPKAESTPVSVKFQDEPKQRLGWPLLQVRRKLSEILADPQPCSPLYDRSMVEPCSIQLLPSSNETNFDSESSDLEVLVRNEIVPYDTKNIPVVMELKDLLERYSSSSCRLFNYEELRRATSDSAPENLIGKGGNSKVYRGVLSDKKEVAVKILKPSEDATREFILEIGIITSLHHKNVISLFGFCFEDKHLLLVYDLLHRGSLEENLHGSRVKRDPSAFGWNERYKVALGVAEAINYLHNISCPPVIHRDVKSSNILLSSDFVPQLSDFGLAKWASNSSQTACCTDIAGTFGYMAPEYFMYGKVTEKIDVYAYGVVLLELLSGRKPISNDHPPKGSRESLVMWARPMLHERNFASLLDRSLGSEYNLDQMERMVLAANLCIRQSPHSRPNMGLVLKLIKGDVEAMRWTRLQTNATNNLYRFCDEEEGFHPSLQSHPYLAFLELIEDDSLSMCSVEQHYSIEDYLRGRSSRSSSFD